jgi:hypothetical protein
VKAINPFDKGEALRGHSVDALWDAADEVEGGKAFMFWFAPFHDENARNSVIQTLNRMEAEQTFLATYPGVLLPPPRQAGEADAVPVVRRDQTGLAKAARRYRGGGIARTFVTVPSKESLLHIVASGASYRLDPVRRIEVTAPGIGAEPTPPVPNAAAQPIVVTIDGGLTARSYKALEAWRAPPLIRDGAADHPHGNRVTSLVVHGHAWNNRLELPDLECRVATVQAVPRQGSNVPTNPEQLIEYLRQVARTFPDGAVWNLSFNEILPGLDSDSVSYLGHEIAAMAREFGILPVISIGNRRAENPEHRLCAPADCEAALTVGGRQFDTDGLPAGPCTVSLLGPGPDGMLKPDVSWFSKLRMLGGGQDTGSSYSTPLISSLAAHTFANLKNPTPDLVRALLINMAERESHDRALGWGTPWDGHMPWLCAPGAVTLAWRSSLLPGYAYYWNDIPIPPELVHNGKLRGKAKLTAILNPIVSDLGESNYFSTRLQVALQYQRVDGKWNNLLGSMKEDKVRETDARADLAKWHPVRRHVRDFSKRGGIGFDGSAIRLHARVFARDLFQFDKVHHSELGEQEVAFVLTLSDGSDSSAIYNSMAQRLSTFVESAVLGNEIEIDH